MKLLAQPLDLGLQPLQLLSQAPDLLLEPLIPLPKRHHKPLHGKRRLVSLCLSYRYIRQQVHISTLPPLALVAYCLFSSISWLFVTCFSFFLVSN
jgi:hypothetical protein